MAPACSIFSFPSSSRHETTLFSRRYRRIFCTRCCLPLFHYSTLDYHIFYDTVDTQASVLARPGSARKWKCMHHAAVSNSRYELGEFHRDHPLPPYCSLSILRKYQFVRSRFDSVRRPSLASSSIFLRRFATSFRLIGFSDRELERGSFSC